MYKSCHSFSFLTGIQIWIKILFVAICYIRILAQHQLYPRLWTNIILISTSTFIVFPRSSRENNWKKWVKVVQLIPSCYIFLVSLSNVYMVSPLSKPECKQSCTKSKLKTDFFVYYVCYICLRLGCLVWDEDAA